jgi:hypothetical protein
MDEDEEEKDRSKRETNFSGCQERRRDLRIMSYWLNGGLHAQASPSYSGIRGWAPLKIRPPMLA